MLTLGIPFSNHINVLNVTGYYNSDSSICFDGSDHSTVSKEHNCSNNFLQAVRSLMQMRLQGYDIEKVQ